MQKVKEHLRPFAVVAIAFFAMIAVMCYAPGYAHAADDNESIAVYTQQGATKTLVGTYTYGTLKTAQLNGYPLVQTDTIGALFNKPGTGFNVVGGKNYVTIDDLLAYANVSSSIWTTGATLHFATTDFPGGYTKYYPTYAEVEGTQNFYPSTTLTSGITTPFASTYAAIAFDSGSAPIAAGGQTASQALSALTWTASPRFMVGLTDSTLNNSTLNMGKRMPSAVTSVTVVLP